LIDDGSRPKILSSEEIHSMHNEIVNNQLKCKYGNNIQQFLTRHFP
jgi:hypothetical protein